MRKHSRGYTLVELAMTLVVIALIAGAASVALGTHRSGEYQKIRQKFIDGWARAYNTYYERTGVVVGDSLDAPTFAVNADADTVIADAFRAVADNDYTGVTPPPRLCQGTKNDIYNEPYADGGRAADASGNLRSFFRELGIRMPTGRAEGREDRYAYLDRNGNPQELQVCFQWNLPGTTWGAGNVMTIRGLTPDLARLLDQSIDGSVNAVAGDFREQGKTDGVAEWSFTNLSDESDPLATDESAQDEGRIKVLTAHWKMNQ